MKRSWVEIDLNKIRDNYSVYRTLVDPSKRIMAVVKANAYGHGDIEVAKELQTVGVSDFAVATLDEGVKLRENGIAGQILILGYTPVVCADQLVKYDITQALLDETYAEHLASENANVSCQFAIDTGMNRIGLNSDDVEYCSKVIHNYSERLHVTGLFTHLCTADSNDENAKKFTELQIQKFKSVTESISDLKFENIHCLNSAGGLWHKADFTNLVRLGIILYGLKPDYSNQLPDGIAPALSWKSVVSMVKDVPAGQTIGYGRTYTAERDSRIATISTGYADGYNRLLSNKFYVLINGRRAPIVGRICMDQFMVDVSSIPNVDIGTEVVLIGKSGTEEITADNMAFKIGTIGYEILCNISGRVERKYEI